MKLIIVLLFALTALSSCSQAEPLEAPPLFEPVTARMDTFIVERGLVESLDILNGVTRLPTEAVRLDAGGGVIAALYAWPGDEVTEGQVLARLDTTRLDEQIENLEESISRARTLHRLQAEEMAIEIDLLELAYADALRALGAAPDEETDFNSLRNRIEWAKLDLDHFNRRHSVDMAEAEASLSELIERRGDTEIIAPFDGVVVIVNASPGPWFMGARAPIMYIARHEGVFVEYIGEAMSVVGLRRGIRARGVIGDRVFELEYTPTSTEEQMYYRRRDLRAPIRFEILAPEGEKPPPGETVFIRFYTVWNENALRVPRNSVFDEPSGAIVYRVADGRQVPAPVTVGAETESFVEILEGLNEGDEVFVRP